MALVSIIAAATVTGGSATALAGWGVPATGLKLTGQAGSLPAGPTPAVKPVPDGVKISWAPAQIPDVTYRISRHTDGGPDVSVCQTGQSSCLDGGVGTGIGYTYSIRLFIGGWHGSEGESSDQVTILGAKVTAPAQVKAPSSQPEGSPASSESPHPSPSASAETTGASQEPSTEPTSVPTSVPPSVSAPAETS